MFAAPAEGTLKDFMEFAETGFADHEQSPPNQRTHATEHYAELINRNRRYGRFRHASSLPKPTRTPSNLTPRNLPLSLKSLLSTSGSPDGAEGSREAFRAGAVGLSVALEYLETIGGIDLSVEGIVPKFHSSRSEVALMAS